MAYPFAVACVLTCAGVSSKNPYNAQVKYLHRSFSGCKSIADIHGYICLVSVVNEHTHAQITQMYVHTHKTAPRLN